MPLTPYDPTPLERPLTANEVELRLDDDGYLRVVVSIPFWEAVLTGLAGSGNLVNDLILGKEREGELTGLDLTVIGLRWADGDVAAHFLVEVRAFYKDGDH